MMKMMMALITKHNKRKKTNSIKSMLLAISGWTHEKKYFKNQSEKEWFFANWWEKNSECQFLEREREREGRGERGE
jgi:hypothetical protein